MEPLGKWFSFANDPFSMTISQFSEMALFQRSLVKSEVILARTLNVEEPESVAFQFTISSRIAKNRRFLLTECAKLCRDEQCVFKRSINGSNHVQNFAKNVGRRRFGQYDQIRRPSQGAGQNLRRAGRLAPRIVRLQGRRRRARRNPQHLRRLQRPAARLAAAGGLF